MKAPKIDPNKEHIMFRSLHFVKNMQKKNKILKAIVAIWNEYNISFPLSAKSLALKIIFAFAGHNYPIYYNYITFFEKVK